MRALGSGAGPLPWQGLPCDWAPGSQVCKSPMMQRSGGWVQALAAGEGAGSAAGLWGETTLEGSEGSLGPQILES